MYKNTGIIHRFRTLPWDTDKARAYPVQTVPGFPDFFTLLSPNTGLDHGGSVITPVAHQIHYIMKLLERTFETDTRTVEVKRDV